MVFAANDPVGDEDSLLIAATEGLGQAVGSQKVFMSRISDLRFRAVGSWNDVNECLLFWVPRLLAKSACLCLPQILSVAGGGRRITAGNQMFGPRFAGVIEKHEKIHSAIDEHTESWPVGQRESAHLSLDRHCGEDC
jgi:hypothetical protein